MEAHHAEAVGNGAGSGGKDGPDEQHRGMFEDGVGEKGLEAYNEGQEFGRHSEHR